MKGRLCIFGEVLFDHFPDGQRVLGGAPFNVAWNLQALGQPVDFISRVGDDAEGKAVREAMRSWGMDTAGLQTDPEHPTGRVSVSLEGGEPSYEIVAPVAYDRIQPPDRSDCGILYHGSLALRDPVSRAALDALLESAPHTVFVDVNLRPPWWRKDQVLEWIDRAHWVKLNTEELELLSQTQADARDAADDFLRSHDLQGLILTHGGAGAELFTVQGEHHQVSPDTDNRVVDTVGAGDAFASVILLGLARNWPLSLTLQRAQSFASALVGQRGATVPDHAYYRKFIDDWQ
jgi:fructokinase